MKIIRTERLRLAPVTAQNSKALWNVLQAPDLREYQDLPKVGAATFNAMVAKRPRRLGPGSIGRFEWLMYLHRHRKPMGWVSLRISGRETHSAEIGYSIVSEFRGRGFAREAVWALLQEGFMGARLDRISAYLMPDNAASRRLLQRLGFRDGGIVPKGASLGGSPVDVRVFHLNKKDWLASANSMEIPAFA
ncbi:MAG: GNAT family N-acetyltransferase [Candidatus Eremiobacteraeota bacterium]|nr:GNAT family N-acetyltransferase [Candidatus Eremiobacteraeota bacterium]